MFYDNLLKTLSEYAERALVKDEETDAEKKLDLLNRNVRQMKERGARSVQIRLRASVRAVKEFGQPGKKVLVHLPVPRECRQVSEIMILGTSHADYRLAPADARSVRSALRRC